MIDFIVFAVTVGVHSFIFGMGLLATFALVAVIWIVGRRVLVFSHHPVAKLARRIQRRWRNLKRQFGWRLS